MAQNAAAHKVLSHPELVSLIVARCEELDFSDLMPDVVQRQSLKAETRSDQDEDEDEDEKTYIVEKLRFKWMMQTRLVNKLFNGEILRLWTHFLSVAPYDDENKEGASRLVWQYHSGLQYQRSIPLRRTKYVYIVIDIPLLHEAGLEWDLTWDQDIKEMIDRTQSLIECRLRLKGGLLCHCQAFASHLRTIKLEDVPLTVCITIISKCLSLKSIELDDCYDTDDWNEPIANSGWPRVESLTIAYSSDGDEQEDDEDPHVPHLPESLRFIALFHRIPNLDYLGFHYMHPAALGALLTVVSLPNLQFLGVRVDASLIEELVDQLKMDKWSVRAERFCLPVETWTAESVTALGILCNRPNRPTMIHFTVEGETQDDLNDIATFYASVLPALARTGADIRLEMDGGAFATAAEFLAHVNQRDGTNRTEIGQAYEIDLSGMPLLTDQL